MKRFSAKALIMRLDRLRKQDGSFAEILGNSSWAFIIKIAGLGTGYLFALAVSRLAGAEAWGVFSLSLTAVTIAAIVSRLGLDTALIRLIAAFKAQGRENAVQGVYWQAAGLVGLAAALITVLAYFFAPFLATTVFNKPHLAAPFRLASFAVWEWSE